MLVFISTFDPNDTLPVSIEEAREDSRYWEVDLNEYKPRLIQHWQDVTFSEKPEPFLLSWSLPIPKTEGGRTYFNLADCMVSFSIYDSFENFVLWHRSVVPKKHRLYLYLEGSLRVLEIQSTTTTEEILDFI
ncbi:MAG: hypothetical protein JXQ72_00785 [Anaerolineae bacterium]|nr:hypothetical protein [Anaerolineae bacterium]